MQNNVTQEHKGLNSILKKAFSYWAKTLGFQVLFSLIYFSVLYAVVVFFAQRLGIMELYKESAQALSLGVEAYQEKLKEISEHKNYLSFNLMVYATLIFLHPLNLGLLKIFRKIDLGEKPQLSDLFAGYLGVNFFIYIGFYLFWFMVYLYTLPTLILAVLWVLATLFTAPLMFFTNKRIFETLSVNFWALKRFPLEIGVCVIIALGFKYLGVVTVVGAIFTFPFWNAMIYALYSRIFNEIEI